MTVSMAAPGIGIEELTGLIETIEGGQLADGPRVRSFESAFADVSDRSHGIATSNGTTALHAALSGLELGRSDTVLTTPFSFIATANAIRLCGATPVFADIDPDTFNLDPAAVRRTIESRDGDVDAIIAVHLYGLPAPMDELGAIAEEYDLDVVEDAAQAHGSTYDGRPVGSLGDVACFSFYPTKNMTTGEGGMVVTDDDSVADRIRRFINHGRDDRYDHVEVGHNFRMTSLGAAVGQAQLEKLPDFVSIRRRNAGQYDDALADHPSITAPSEPPAARHSYHQYTVRCEDRSALRAELEDAGIDTGVYYPTPIHEQPAYEGIDASLPVAERVADDVLSIPVHPSLKQRDVDRIADRLRRFEP